MTGVPPAIRRPPRHVRRRAYDRLFHPYYPSAWPILLAAGVVYFPTVLLLRLTIFGAVAFLVGVVCVLGAVRLYVWERRYPLLLPQDRLREAAERWQTERRDAAPWN